MFVLIYIYIYIYIYIFPKRAWFTINSQSEMPVHISIVQYNKGMVVLGLNQFETPAQSSTSKKERIHWSCEHHDCAKAIAYGWGRKPMLR